MNKTHYPYIIAEIGCNHNGDIDLAKKMIKGAKDAGVDAIKLQLFTKDNLITDKHIDELEKGVVKLENIEKWETKELGLNSIRDQLEKFVIGRKEHEELFDYARKLKVDYASTPVTEDGVDFLVEQKVSFLKIASMDANNPDFIRYTLSKKLPTIISLGLASMGETEQIVQLIPQNMKDQVTLLHTISLYPPKDQIVNLRFLQTLKTAFGVRVGYSDHTLGFSIPLASVAMGAEVIEKHFTLNKEMPGWDHKVSANPEELKIICSESKRIWESLGDGIKNLTPEEIEKRLKFRRSLVSIRDISAGEILTRNDFCLKRPGTGIPPDETNRIIGHKAKHDIPKDQTINWTDIQL